MRSASTARWRMVPSRSSAWRTATGPAPAASRSACQRAIRSARSSRSATPPRSARDVVVVEARVVLARLRRERHGVRRRPDRRRRTRRASRDRRREPRARRAAGAGRPRRRTGPRRACGRRRASGCSRPRDTGPPIVCPCDARSREVHRRRRATIRPRGLESPEGVGQHALLLAAPRALIGRSHVPRRARSRRAPRRRRSASGAALTAASSPRAIAPRMARRRTPIAPRARRRCTRARLQAPLRSDQLPDPGERRRAAGQHLHERGGQRVVHARRVDAHSSRPRLRSRLRSIRSATRSICSTCRCSSSPFGDEWSLAVLAFVERPPCAERAPWRRPSRGVGRRPAGVRASVSSVTPRSRGAPASARAVAPRLLGLSAVGSISEASCWALLVASMVVRRSSGSRAGSTARTRRAAARDVR